MTFLLRLACVLCGIAATSLCDASVTRLGLVVGNNVGKDGELPLQFAETDAQAIGNLLHELGGFDRERVKILLRGDDLGLQRELDQLRGRIAEIRANGNSALFLFYYSGHGDREALHLGNSIVDLKKLRQDLAVLGADVTLGIFDACHSGSITRTKGGMLAEPFEISVDQESSSKGLVLISSASADELAQESLELKSSIFTHHLVSGLRGGADFDLDGRVTLREAYTAAYHQTLSQSLTASGRRQHPIADIDLTGTGDVVLSFLAKSAGSVLFPAESEGQYSIVHRTNRRVVAELDKQPGRPQRIALPSGDYQLYKQQRTTYLTGPVSLVWGGQHLVDDRAMARIPYAIYASKGMPARRWGNRIGMVIERASGVQPGMNGTTAFGIDYRRFVTSATSIGVAIDFTREVFVPEGKIFSVTHSQWALDGSWLKHLEVSSQLPFLTLSPGIVGELATARQNQPGPVDERFWAFGIGPQFGIELQLPDRWTAVLFGRGLLTWTDLPGNDNALLLSPDQSIPDPGDIRSTPILTNGEIQNLIVWKTGLTFSKNF